MKCFTQVHTENNWHSWAVSQGDLFPKSEVVSAALYLFWNLIRDSLRDTISQPIVVELSLLCALSALLPSPRHCCPHHPSPVTQAILTKSCKFDVSQQLCCYTAQRLYCHSFRPLSSCLGHRHCWFTGLSTSAFLISNSTVIKVLS